MAARLVETTHFDLWHEVPLVPQRTEMSCWAAAAAMVVGWRDCLDVDQEEIVHGTGQWASYRDGLRPSDVETLRRVWGLEVVERGRIELASLRALLEEHGPLWVGEAAPGLHVVTITGAYGDGSPGGSFLRVNDPWPEGRGERYVLPFLDFARGFRAVSDVAGVPACILHAPGRVVGRGTHRARSRRVEYGAAASVRAARERLSRGDASMDVIVIDPGHGGAAAAGKSTPYGARGAGGVSEAAVNFELAERVRRRLGQAAVLTRAERENRSLAERAVLARRRGASVFLSLHTHEYGGAHETWVHSMASRQSAALAEEIGGRLAARYGSARRVQRGELAVLHPQWHEPTTAACLIEASALAAGDRELDQLASCICDGVQRYAARLRFGRGAAALDQRPAVDGRCAVWESEADYRKACQQIESLFDGRGDSTAQALGFLPSYAQLTPAQIATATAVYGSSIDYGLVYLTDVSGANDRPFTVYVPLRGIQVINAGTLTPGPALLIHELAHVWQSQHASDPKAFMSNSLKSQGVAVAKNLAEGSADPLWPYSPYAYVPGSAFSSYAAEQIANQIERGEAAIVAHAAGVATGAPDPDNDTSLGTARVEDRRVSGVVS